MLVKLIKLIKLVYNFVAVGDGSDKGDIDNVGKLAKLVHVCIHS